MESYLTGTNVTPTNARPLSAPVVQASVQRSTTICPGKITVQPRPSKSARRPTQLVATRNIGSDLTFPDTFEIRVAEPYPMQAFNIVQTEYQHKFSANKQKVDTVPSALPAETAQVKAFSPSIISHTVVSLKAFEIPLGETVKSQKLANMLTPRPPSTERPKGLKESRRPTEIAVEQQGTARRHVRTLSGLGNHQERLEAICELSEMIQQKKISIEWLASQGTLTADLLSLCAYGTNLQKEKAIGLISKMSTGPTSVKRSIADAHVFGEAMAALLKSSVKQEAAGAEAVWTLSCLAQDEDARQKIGAVPSLLVLLSNMAKQIFAQQLAQESQSLRQILATVRILSFQNRDNCLVLITQGLQALLLYQIKREDHKNALNALGLMAELSSADEDELEFRRALSSIDGISETLLYLLQSGSIDLKLQALICLRNILTVPSFRDSIQSWMPKLFKNLDNGLLSSETADDAFSLKVQVAVLDVLRVTLSNHSIVDSVHEMQNLNRSVHHLLLHCQDNLLDRTLAFLCTFAKTYYSDKCKPLDSLIFDALIGIMKQEQNSLRTKLCAACIRNFALHEYVISKISPTCTVLDPLISLCHSKASGSSRQAFEALCNLAKEANFAIQLCDHQTFMTLVKSNMRGGDGWMAGQSAMVLKNIFEHSEIINKYSSDRNLIQLIITCAQSNLGPEAKLNASIALASMSSNHRCCEIIVSYEHHSIIRIVHGLQMDQEGRYTQHVVVGLWALSNLAGISEKFRNSLGVAKTPLETAVRILHEMESDAQEVEAALSLIKNSVLNSPENCKIVASISRALPTLSFLSTQKSQTCTYFAIAALVSLTGESELARSCEIYPDEVIKAISDSLHSESRDLRHASVGLICNLCQTNERLDIVAKFGSQQGIFSDIINLIYTEPCEQLRATAILALASLARSDANKLAIGKEPNLVASLQTVLASDSEIEKAHLALMMHFLGFIFINNSTFGQIPGALGGLVQLVAGSEKQSENSIAAISVLVCCSSNATVVVQQMSDQLLPLLRNLLVTGNRTQQINSLVCLWNLAASGQEARERIGKESGIFPLLIGLIKTIGEEAVWQVAGLVGELMRDSERNAMLFFKTAGALQTLLNLALESEDDQVELNAAVAIVNFALNAPDMNIKALSEQKDGLIPVARVIKIGLPAEGCKAMRVLANPFLRSLSGRKKIAAIPGLVKDIIAAILTGDDATQKASAEILQSLSMSMCTRPMLAAFDELLAIIQDYVTDNSISSDIRRPVFGCLANLVLNVEFCTKVVQNRLIIKSILTAVGTGHKDFHDFALETLHNMLATNSEFRNQMAGSETLLQSLVRYTISQDSKAALHATGALYQICKGYSNSGTFPGKLLSDPNIIPNLVKCIQVGGEKQKELACAMLAILGENDDDVSSITDDRFNMMVAMADGALHALSKLFIRGTGQQSLHATAVLSNLLITTGAFIKGQLADTDDFLPTLVRCIQSSGPFHRLYALRLFFHLIKGDVFICEQACQDANLIRTLFEAAESGSTCDHRAYAFYSLAEIVTYDTDMVSNFDSGQVYRLLGPVLNEKEANLVRSGLQLLKSLCLNFAARCHIWATHKLVGSIASAAMPESPQNLNLSLEILIFLTPESEKRAACVSEIPSLLNAISNALLSNSRQTRINAALLIYNIASTSSNAQSIASTQSVFDHLFQLISSDVEDEAKSACMALSQILQFQKETEEDNDRLRQMLKGCINLLCDHQKQEEDFSSWDEYILRCLLGAALSTNNGLILAESSVFPVLVQRMHKQSKHRFTEIILAIICNLIENSEKSKLDFALCEGSMEMVLQAIRGSIHESEGAFRALNALSRSSFEICTRLRNQDGFWATLLVFLDDRNLQTEISESAAYFDQRKIALDNLLLHAMEAQDFRGIISHRHSVQILSRLVTNGVQNLRMKSMTIIRECCASDKHFASKLGGEKHCINAILECVTSRSSAVGLYRVRERILALEILTHMAGIDEHCEHIGQSNGFLESLIQIMMDREAQTVGLPDNSEALEDASYLSTQASACLRAYCSRKEISAFALRLGFPVVESLLKTVLSETDTDRIHSLSNLWSMACGGKTSLMVMSKYTVAMYDTLCKLFEKYRREIQQGLMMISSLLTLPGFRFAMLKHRLLNLIVGLIESDNDLISIPAIRIIEDLARQEESSKRILGNMTILAETVLRVKLQAPEHVALAAEGVINELCKDNELNAGLFRRLRGKYLEG